MFILRWIVINNEIKHFTILKKIWELINHDPIFDQLLKKYGNDNANPFKQYLKNCFIGIFPNQVVQIQMAKNLIKEEKPSLLVLQNEYGSFERALLIVLVYKMSRHWQFSMVLSINIIKGICSKKGKFPRICRSYSPFCSGSR